MGKIIRDGNIITPTTYIAPKAEPEYVSFYDSYSFWVKFWEMYIKLFASPIFETDRSYYV